MTSGDAIHARLQRAKSELSRRGQEHVLRWWDQLDSRQRHQLLDDIESIPWPAIDAVMDTLIRRPPAVSPSRDLAPAPFYPARPGPELAQTYAAARTRGTELLRAGKVAAFTVAGGQGTRLGISGPKGMVGVTPTKQKSLFQLFAEMVRSARRRYDAAIPWYIMTSPANHDMTVGFLEQHDFFGLPEKDLLLFPQGTLPAFDFQGRLLLEERYRLSLAPDGHGGSLKALVGSGAIADMCERGIGVISYFQIDNPLVQPFDPLFLGLHARTQSEMSTKVARKAHDLEKVGNLCLADGKLKVIEYIEMPEELARQRNPDGSRRFDAANLAMHLLDVAFVDQVAGQSTGLPLRRAEKAVSFLGDTGERVQPHQPNAVKLETFVFDVLPLARNPLLLEVDRAEEFSPVKNATGLDSLETARRDQIVRALRWLARVGVKVGRRGPDCAAEHDLHHELCDKPVFGSGTSPGAVVVEISPLFALDAEELATRVSLIPPIREGSDTYLE